MAKINATVCFFIFWFVFCFGGMALAQTPTIVYTPNGSVVPNTYIVPEFSQAQIIAGNNYVAQYYPLATRLSDASQTYNCHGYAWYKSQGGTPVVWIGWNTPPGAQAIFWNDGSYTSVSSCQTNGERVRYSNDDHSAVTTYTTDIFISKWGSLPLMEHNKDYTPYNSTGLIYYLGTSKVTGASLICTSASYSLQAAPAGASLTWSSSNPSGLSVNSSTGVATVVNNFHGTVAVQATVSNSCGSSTGSANVWVGAPPADISTLIWTGGNRGVNPLQTGTGATYAFNVDPVPNTTSYTWLVPFGFVANGPKTTTAPSISVTTSTTPGTYALYCRANNACGSSWANSLTLNNVAGGGGIQLVVFPNPASSSLTVRVTDSLSANTGGATLDQPYQLLLLDRSSGKVLSAQSEERTLDVPVGNLPPGIYYLNLIYKGAVLRKQVVIAR